MQSVYQDITQAADILQKIEPAVDKTPVSDLISDARKSLTRAAEMIQASTETLTVSLLDDPDQYLYQLASSDGMPEPNIYD